MLQSKDTPIPLLPEPSSQNMHALATLRGAQTVPSFTHPRFLARKTNPAKKKWCQDDWEPRTTKQFRDRTEMQTLEALSSLVPTHCKMFTSQKTFAVIPGLM